MPIQAYNGNEPYIFISYAHKDMDTVLPIVSALQDAGFRIWYDAGIEVGTEWPEYIAEHLERASRVIAFISPAFMESQNCRREINFSIDLNKEPIAVYLEDFPLTLGMRMQLGTLQALFRSKHTSFDSFIDALSDVNDLQICRDKIDISDISAIEAHLKKLVEDRIFHTAIAYAKRVLALDEKNAVAYRYLLFAELGIVSEGELALQNEPLDAHLSYQNYIRFADAASSERFQRYNHSIRDRLFGKEAQARAKEKREMTESMRTHVSALLVSQTSEKQSLEKEVAAAEELYRKKGDPKRVKVFSIVLVVMALLQFSVFIIAMFVNRTDNDLSLILMMIWLALFFLYPIMTLVHCLALKRNFWLWLLNLVTLFLFSFFWAISMLTYLPKQKALGEEILLKKGRITALEEQIAAGEARLKEINAALKTNAID